MLSFDMMFLFDVGVALSDFEGWYLDGVGAEAVERSAWWAVKLYGEEKEAGVA